MLRVTFLAMLVVLLSFPSQADAMFGSSKEKRFWTWFEENEELLYSFEKNAEQVFAQLSTQLGKVDENLTFLFSPPSDDGTREFILSANGIAASFPAVEALHAAAPNLPGWSFGKYRPRLEPPEHITLAERALMPGDISYRMYEDGEKVGFLIFMEGLTEQDLSLFQHIGFLFLDHILGEHDVGTKVGFIEFLPATDDRVAGASPLTDLAGQFDEYFQQRKSVH